MRSVHKRDKNEKIYTIFFFAHKSVSAVEKERYWKKIKHNSEYGSAFSSLLEG